MSEPKVLASMVPRASDPAYVERILQPARELGFPDWYVSRLRR